MKPHKHADVIIAWANGAEIQFKEKNSSQWVDCVTSPSWLSDSYRVKPERVYPKSSLTIKEMKMAYYILSMIPANDWGGG